MAKLMLRHRSQHYWIYHPTEGLIGEFQMPRDGKYNVDTKSLTDIGRVLSKRWGLTNKKN